ncbi:MAG: SDR family oxidoreductase [Bacteroidia bacterium]|nr:SDR family oxidoreductase [Bacteroidia bacterium]MDW8159583.1 SDR family oxidoreductase [Bacteroidia bacterium]
MKYLEDIFSLKGKVAIVTGAAGLLGKAHCQALAGAGAHIVAVDLPGTNLNDLLQELPAGPHLSCYVDITQKNSLVACRDTILKNYSQIDILVNNAAINDSFESPLLAAELSQFENYPLEAWNKAMEVNITGIFLCCQIWGTVMAQAGKGSIINIASTYGIVGPDQSLYQNPEGEQTFYKSPSYPTAKGAIISFTRYLAAYWGKRGVRVNALSPGGVENQQDSFFIQNYSKRTLLGRMAQPNDYQGALIFLASDASSYMTGANLVVDGGWTAI